MSGTGPKGSGRRNRPGKDLMAKTSPAEFVKQVRQETSKVTWPTRRETMVTTIMVLIMSVVAAIFFLLADLVLSNLVQLVLGLGG